MAYRKQRDEEPPTLGTFAAPHPLQPTWFWATCPICIHRRPMRWRDLSDRLGPATPVARAQQALRCTRCGRKGCGTMMPSWRNIEVGWEPFPDAWTIPAPDRHPARVA